MYNFVMPRTSLCGLENMGCSCHCSSAQKNKDYHHRKFVASIIPLLLTQQKDARVANSREFHPYPGMHKSSIEVH